MIVNAALTFGNTAINGDAGIQLDTTSTISIGTSTASGIKIGNPSATITLYGPTTITATTTIQSLVVSSTFTLSYLMGSSTQCLHVDAAGVVTGTGSDCGLGGNTLVSQRIVTSGLVCAYAFTDNSGTNVTDVSGNGNTATLNGATWLGSPTGGISLSGSSNVNLPTGCNNTKSWIFYANYNSDQYNNPFLPSFLVASTTNFAFSLDFSYTFATPNFSKGLFTWNGSYSSQATAYSKFNGIGSLGFVENPSTDNFYINGTLLTNTSGSQYLATTNIPATVLSPDHLIIGGCNCQYGSGSWLVGNIYYALGYNRALSSAEEVQNATALQNIMSLRGVTPSYSANAIPRDTNNTASGTINLDGDSIALGMGNSGINPLSFLVTSSPIIYPNSLLFNTAVPGETVDNNTLGLPKLVAPLYSAQGAENINILFSGHNDIVALISIPYIESAIQRYAATARSEGFKVIVSTSISGNNGYDTLVVPFNAWIRQNWKSFADGIADIAASPNMGATGAYASSTYYYDAAIHPNAYSYANIFAPIFANEINLISGEQNYPLQYVNTTANYNMATGTNITPLLNADPTGGSLTVTLPAAVGIEGNCISVKNIATSGTNTVIVVPTSTIPLDGTSTEYINNHLASFVLSTSTNARFCAQFNGTITWGGHWEVTP